MSQCFQNSDGNDRWIGLIPTVFFQEQHSSYARTIFQIERVYGAYMWNSVFVNFLCVLLHSCVAVLSPTDISDRLGIGITLLLTIVALRHSMSERLPVASYLTLLDKYFLFSLLWLVLCIIEVAAGPILLANVLCSAEHLDHTCTTELDLRFHTKSAQSWVVLHMLGLPFLPLLRRPWDQVHSQYLRQTLEH